MPIPASLNKNLSLPVICAPMFIISNPDLVIAQCKSGVIGSFPALNARPKELLDEWLTRIKAELAADPNAAPFAVNQIIHPSNERLEHDMALCVKHEVPLIITSLSAPTAIVPHVHAYGGQVFHDVISVRHAEKALEAGVDGLILVCAGAGGHAGTLSPFALVGEIRKFYDGPIALSGSITNGQAILAAQAMGADFAYIGTRFIATHEAHAVDAYKQAIVDSAAKDVVYTPYFTGVHGNYLSKSIVAAGLDPANLPVKDKSAMSFGGARDAKAWKDIWGAGQGVGTIDDVMPTVELVARLKQEYRAAKTALCSSPF
ncbi:NAD(P)H-dependent flavin oxidoreductase [Ferribacterium limneticum]|uniref:NAD(P)H-dependent flavin oxidoreductase n=1 Tax=Ferribacterium limneticum TaxID=76259 RepID=UPI001CF97912|nr:nitronate monooxygenase family protein [Ferribacterium limneticum]UCV27147.1 nitronate monooxygenase [Ferribacterium limneticum]UCV31064.1 nitronate monooxygenase [Ferribacterium limneticum]